MRARIRAVLGLGVSCALVASACDAPTELDPLVSVRTTQGVYSPGSIVVIGVRNATGRAVVNDRCAGGLQGWTLGSFGGPPPLTASRTCATPLPPIRIEAGASAEDTLQLLPGFEPGQWRVQLDLRDEQGRLLDERERTTNTFVVQ